MNNENTSRIEQRPNGEGGYIDTFIFNCHDGTLTITNDNCGFISSSSTLKDLEDDGTDNTEYFAAIDGIEAMVIGLVEHCLIGYRNHQINPDTVADIINSAIMAAANNL